MATEEEPPEDFDSDRPLAFLVCEDRSLLNWDCVFVTSLVVALVILSCAVLIKVTYFPFSNSPLSGRTGRTCFGRLPPLAQLCITAILPCSLCLFVSGFLIVLLGFDSQENSFSVPSIVVLSLWIILFSASIYSAIYGISLVSNGHTPLTASRQMLFAFRPGFNRDRGKSEKGRQLSKNDPSLVKGPVEFSSLNSVFLPVAHSAPVEVSLPVASEVPAVVPKAKFSENKAKVASETAKEILLKASAHKTDVDENSDDDSVITELSVLTSAGSENLIRSPSLPQTRSNRMISGLSRLDELVQVKADLVKEDFEEKAGDIIVDDDGEVLRLTEAEEKVEEELTVASSSEADRYLLQYGSMYTMYTQGSGSTNRPTQSPH